MKNILRTRPWSLVFLLSTALLLFGFTAALAGNIDPLDKVRLERQRRLGQLQLSDERGDCL